LNKPDELVAGLFADYVWEKAAEKQVGPATRRGKAAIVGMTLGVRGPGILKNRSLGTRYGTKVAR
jgi:hypothetical protein